MSDTALVDQAAGWAKALTQREARGPGDIENAWRRLESRYGIGWRVFWALRYRKPTFLTASTFSAIYSAYRAECERQMRKLQNEIETTKAITGTSHSYVDEISALVGSDYAQED